MALTEAAAIHLTRLCDNLRALIELRRVIEFWLEATRSSYKRRRVVQDRCRGGGERAGGRRGRAAAGKALAAARAWVYKYAAQTLARLTFSSEPAEVDGSVRPGGAEAGCEGGRRRAATSTRSER
jgi:hypothetical protein